jgi:hypothetical protein
VLDDHKPDLVEGLVDGLIRSLLGSDQLLEDLILSGGGRCLRIVR